MPQEYLQLQPQQLVGEWTVEKWETGSEAVAYHHGTRISSARFNGWES